MPVHTIVLTGTIHVHKNSGDVYERFHNAAITGAIARLGLSNYNVISEEVMGWHYHPENSSNHRAYGVNFQIQGVASFIERNK